MREKKQMPSLDLIEFQDTGHVVEKGCRDFDGTALFEPCVPSDADTRQGCNFLAAEPWRPPTFARRQADVER